MLLFYGYVGDLSFEKEQGPSPFKVDKEIEEQADKDLEMLIQIACKLTQDKKKSKSKKDREAIVDVDNLELSLDVPSEKPASSRPSKVMDISLEEIRKALDSDMDKDNDETIKVMGHNLYIIKYITPDYYTSI